LVEFYVETREQEVNVIENGKEVTKPFIVYYDEPPKPKPFIVYYDEEPEQRPFVPAPISPLVVSAPQPFSYEDDHQVPWKYECSFSTIEKTMPVSDVDGITRSGRCYSPETAESSKGKARIDDEPVMIRETDQGAKPVSEKVETAPTDESGEFLKIIKQSEYNVMDQLNKTPARVSLLALLLNSEAH